MAIDYSLIVVSRWREERAHGRTGDEAVQRAMETAGRAVVFSGITVAIGLLALIALPLPFLRSMGYGGMLIPLVSTIVAITLLPVVLAKLGPRLDWPHRRTDDKASRAWTRWAEAVSRRRWVAAGAGSALIVALAVAATNLQLGSADANTIAKKGDAKAGARGARARRDRGGLDPPPRDPRPGRDQPRQGGRDLSKVKGIHGAVAPNDPSWRRGGTALVEAIPVPDSGTPEGGTTLDEVRTTAHAAGPDVRVGGGPAANDDFIKAVYGSFPLMIALIAITTFILLARAFRSLLLPLKAIILNVLSVAAAWGVLVLVWQQGHGSEAIFGIQATGSISSWIPLMVFAFLFGLSMDYEVFILSRMREEYDRTGSTHTAVVGDRANRPPGHQRGADPVPGLHRHGLGAGHRGEGLRHRPRRRDPARRDGDPGADRARGDLADGPLELVAAELAGPAAAGRALAAPAGGHRRGRRLAAQVRAGTDGPLQARLPSGSRDRLESGAELLISRFDRRHRVLKTRQRAVGCADGVDRALDEDGGTL